MVYKNKNLCKIRTITTFLTLDKNSDLWEEKIKKAAKFCEELSKKFNKNDYEVQSIRVVTNAFNEYLNTSTLALAKKDLEKLSFLLKKHSRKDLRLRFAIGEAKSIEDLKLLPELIASFGDLCNACVNIKKDEFDILDNKMLLEASKVVKKISKITPNGEGNFNFTINFNCKEFIPYFPASYHDSSLEDSFVIGYETPDLLVNVLKDFNNKNKINSNYHESFDKYFKVLHEALQYHVDNTKAILDDFKNNDFKFVGIDSSAAPSKNCSSMVEVYKLLGVEYFGAAGSVEVSSFLTKVFKSVKNLPLVGFSGLMLAVIEDLGLALNAKEKKFDIRTLLTNSAVCGIGLDTVPIEGSTSIEKIAAISRDCGTMAFRLNKPLTVRLFPCEDLTKEHMTNYESDDLCNTKVLEVY